MKKILFIIIILFSNYSFSCKCIKEKLVVYFQKADFVAKVKVNKIVLIEKKNGYQIAKLEIINLYKGKRTKYINLNLGGYDPCGLDISTNSTWLIYATIDENGNLNSDACSGSLQLDKKMLNSDNTEIGLYKKSIERKLSILKFLKRKNIKNINEYNLNLIYNKPCSFSFKKDKEINRKFAIYKLMIDKNLKIINVNAIKEFDNRVLSNDLINCLKNNVSVDNSKFNTISNNTTLYLIYYQYYNESTNDVYVYGNEID